jgi:hypothetical protein
VALTRQPTSTLSSSPFKSARLPCRSCTLTLLLFSLSCVSSLANYLTATLWIGTLSQFIACVRGQTVRSLSQCPRPTGGYTLIERRWRCAQHYLFSCKASPCGCPDPTDLWEGLCDLLPDDAPARERMRLVLRVDSFDEDVVRARCMPWLLVPFSFLQGCYSSRRDAVCSVLAAFVFLVGASVADDAVPVGSCVLACGFVHCSLSALALPPASCVAGRCPLSFRPARGAEAKAPWQGSTCRPVPPPQIAKVQNSPTSRPGRGRFGRRCEAEGCGLGRATKHSRTGRAGVRERSERFKSREKLLDWTGQ